MPKPPSPPSPGVSERARILVLHGPNLNLLGSREPEIYGKDTLAAIDERLHAKAAEAAVELDCFQSNAESQLIDRVQRAQTEKTQFIIVNPAAFTHTSIALRDTFAAVRIPFIEVHLSNVLARETFRRRSYFSDLAVGVISGLGAVGYEMALDYALRELKG